MPFELTNAIVTLQSYLNKILTEKLDIFMILYLYDIFIYIENERKEYVEAIWWVLKQLQKYS